MRIGRISIGRAASMSDRRISPRHSGHHGIPIPLGTLRGKLRQLVARGELGEAELLAKSHPRGWKALGRVRRQAARMMHRKVPTRES